MGYLRTVSIHSTNQYCVLQYPYETLTTNGYSPQKVIFVERFNVVSISFLEGIPCAPKVGVFLHHVGVCVCMGHCHQVDDSFQQAFSLEGACCIHEVFAVALPYFQQAFSLEGWQAHKLQTSLEDVR